MGTRFLAVLAVMALGAGSAMVGLTMASGSWNVLGTGLEPGTGYALRLTGQADRLKLELANATADPLATFSVYSPGGQRAGFFSLDGNTRSAEVVASQGTWLVFVYKAQGGDLTVAVHGAQDAGRFAPAKTERREVVLGNVPRTVPVDATYTAILEQEPVLAGIYLRGSARAFQSELRTEKGIVEVVNEQEASAADTGLIVDSRGERATIPGNLQAGPFTAKVKADSLSGTLVLAALYLKAPDFKEDVPLPGADEEDERELERERERESSHDHKHKHKPGKDHAKPKPAPAAPRPPREGRMAMPEPEFTECGTAENRVPYALAVDSGAVLRVRLGEERDPWVTVFDPADRILAIVQLEAEGDEQLVPLPGAGEYVLYARGNAIEVAVLGVEACELAQLDVEPVVVAAIRGEAFLDGSSQQLPFGLGIAPLEFGIRLASPDAAAFQLRAVFTGPAGEAATVEKSFGLGLTGGSFPMPFGGFEGRRGGDRSAHAESDAQMMLDGEWLLDLEAQVLQGDVEAYALHYVRAGATDEA